MIDRRSALLLAAAGLLPPLAARSQGAAVPMRIGYVPVIGAAPLFVMAGTGWMREAGIEPALTKFESGPPAIQALASGTLDVLFVGIAPVAVARSKGLPVRVVAASGIGGSGFAVQAPLAAAFDAAGGKARDAFARFREIAGRPAKLATLPAGGTPTVALRYWLKTEQVAEADIQVVPMGIESVQGAMLSGAVDGGTVLEPSLTLVRQRNPKIRTIAYSAEMFPNLPGVVVAVTDGFATREPKAVESLVRLAIRARQLILDRPAEAAPHIQSVLAGGLVGASVYEAALGSRAITFVVDPRLIVEATRASLAFEVEIGDFPVAPPTDGLFDPSWYLKVAGR